MEIKIIELQPQDINEVKELAALVIKDSFHNDGVAHKYKKYLSEEIIRVQKKFDQDQKENYYFLIAKENNKVVGTAGYALKIAGPIQLALNQLQLSDKSVVELISFYIHPQHQGKGIGPKLLKALLTHLKQADYQYFSLYTGYQKAKDFWRKKLGEPDVILPKYFEKSLDCHVWVKPI
ncbi:MAG: GNAT family N-acetyltransferase [Microgenomates group bacterium]|jgi:GNAT superfamily N-acetyltransferase